MAKRKQQNLIKGNASHRRTEGDYMSTLLDTVTLDDWQDVVSSTLAAAKQGDAQARAWLAQYLVGKPAGKAPTPLTVVVQQLNNADPIVEKLAHKTVWNMQFPEDDWKENVKATIAAELAEKIPAMKTIVSPEPARLSEDLDCNQSS